MTPQERKVMELALQALESVWQYGSDTLSGPVKGQSDDRKWQRDGVLEMTNRAYRPIKTIKEALAQPQLRLDSNKQQGAHTMTTDLLQAYKDGYHEGRTDLLEFVSTATGMQFASVADLIIFLMGVK